MQNRSSFHVPRWARGSVLALAFLSIIGPGPAGCNSSSSSNTGQFVACQMNSDCNPGLICTLGFLCRPACKTSADCGNGGSCVTDPLGHPVCRSPQENRTPCDVETMCPAPLSCASDYRCRNACSTDADCDTAGITGRECAIDLNGAHYCADTTQVNGAGVIDVAPPLLDDGGVLTTPAPVASDAGPAGELDAEANTDSGQPGSDATVKSGVDASVDAQSGPQPLPATADAFMSPGIAGAFGPVGMTPEMPGAPYTCGTESVMNGVLTLTKGGLCSAQTGVVANDVVLDPTQYVLTGDFDVQVHFALTTFPLPTTIRYMGMRISSPDATMGGCWSTQNCPGLAIERYDNGGRTPIEYYKIYDVDPSVGVATLAPSMDMTGEMRITRQGNTMLAYYLVGTTWVPARSYTANGGPMAIQFYTGSCPNSPFFCSAPDQVDQSVSFSQLFIAHSVQDGGVATGGSDASTATDAMGASDANAVTDAASSSDANTAADVGME